MKYRYSKVFRFHQLILLFFLMLEFNRDGLRFSVRQSKYIYRYVLDVSFKPLLVTYFSKQGNAKRLI